ncbi:hypothetical protein FZEAL_681 [Fusarium zealandicum]|uniref:Ysc84 actin-binding domain-containing protein n=1 Tax=Fusarium zealandicum TaxID=1053134 RepID=A0A8H4UUQ8_9HYPO|nr:hypothetical protein FZEAL_681 [Fusarium zealandicum]
MQKVTAKLPSWDKTKAQSKKGFDKVWGWADKLGAPVNRLSNRIGSEAFWPTTLDKESDKAARILRSFCKDGFYTEEEKLADQAGPKQKQRVLKKIPQKVIENAVGLAIFTTMRTGLWVSGAGGSGVLVARNEDGSWSPPSGILLHTAGLGFLVGVDIYDCVVVINTRKALEAFTKIRATLGGEISAVAGPVGAGGVLENDGKWKQVNRPVFTYLKSRGFYAGVQVDGTVIIERTDENARFYGETIGVADILAGKARHPPPEIKMLMETLKAAEGRTDVDLELMDELEGQPAPGDVDVDAPSDSMFGIPDLNDPDPYGVLALEKEGFEIRDAATRSRPSSQHFEYHPSPSSPVYSKFYRRSMETAGTRSKRESYTSFTDYSTRQSSDRPHSTTEAGTQTEPVMVTDISPPSSTSSLYDRETAKTDQRSVYEDVPLETNPKESEANPYDIKDGNMWNSEHAMKHLDARIWLVGNDFDVAKVSAISPVESHRRGEVEELARTGVANATECRVSASHVVGYAGGAEYVVAGTETAGTAQIRPKMDVAIYSMQIAHTFQAGQVVSPINDGSLVSAKEHKPEAISSHEPENGQMEDIHIPAGGDKDVVLDFIANLNPEIKTAPISAEESRKVLWKIDLIVLPLMVVTSILAAVDKNVIGNTALLGILQDTELVGNQLSWRFLVAKLLAITVVGWAALAMSMAAAHNFAGLATVRFLMGGLEAIVCPVNSIITVMWWTRTEQPIRTAIWLNTLFTVITGTVSYAIGLTNTNLAPWRLLYLVVGGFSAVWSVVVWIFLPDSPATCWQLSDREEWVAIQRGKGNNTGIQDTTFKWYQVKELLSDPKTWLLVTFAAAQNVPNGGISSFSGLIVAGFGFNKLQSILINLPTGTLGTIFQIILSIPSSKLVVYRCAIIVLADLVPLSCAALLWKLPKSNKVTMNALWFIAYSVGNIFGPQAFTSKDAPTYTGGFIGLLICIAVAIASISLYGVLRRWENTKRDQSGATDVDELDGSNEAFTDMTDKEKKSFRYSY